MLRLTIFLACWSAALAQTQLLQQQFQPKPEPMQAALQVVWQARNAGHFEEAQAAREQARSLLGSLPADAPNFGGWVMQVAQLYQASDANMKALAILQDGLARTAPLGESNNSRIGILTALGDYWRQDGNLLKAVKYLEQAAAAQAAAPPAAMGQAGSPFFIRTASRNVTGYVNGGAAPGAVYAYMRLAELYQQLGWPDAVAAVAAKVRARSAGDPGALARFYEQRGQLEEATAIYKGLVDQATDSQGKLSALQSLSNAYARQGRYTEAVAATRQAIATAQALDNDGARNQGFWLRQNLAGLLNQAGQTDQADAVHLENMRENRGGPQEAQAIGIYAQHLAATKRGEQGESLLKEFADSHPNLEPMQRANIYSGLANMAGNRGDEAAAERYRMASQVLQPPPVEAQRAQRSPIMDDVRKAQDALTRHRLEDAYSLTLRVIDSASQPGDGQQAAYLVPQVANALWAAKEPAKGEQLFQRLFAQSEAMSLENMQRPIGIRLSYIHYLMAQPERLADVPAAIARYRAALADAYGPESGRLVDPVRVEIEFARNHQQWQRADLLVRQLLELQEALSGNTSEPYLGDLQMAARVSETAGDFPHAIALFRQAIVIADLVSTRENDWHRPRTRMDTAFALARAGQFEEAETLGVEAVALGGTPRVPRPPLAQELEQIREMKKAAAVRGK